MAKEPARANELFNEVPPGVVFTDEQIERAVKATGLIDAANFEPRGLDVCSYDVRIGKKAIVGGQGKEIDLTKDQLEIPPGAYAAVISLERVHIPANIVVRINTKRSFSYEGIALLTGTQIDPGYRGHLLFGFYNASSRRAVLRMGRAICSLVFETLAGPVSRPKAPDPDLLNGNFPDRFVNDMANMEVLSWHQLSENVKQIEKIAKDLLDLRGKYENVVQPIRDLTNNVESLRTEVKELTGSIREIGTQVLKLEGLTGKNAEQISQINTSVQLMVGEVGHVKKSAEQLADTDKKQEERITELHRRFGTFSILVYIFWALCLIVLSGLFTKFILPKLIGG